MRNRRPRIVSLFLFLLPAVIWTVTSRPVESEAAQRYKWWQSAEVQTEIGLTPEQGVRIEAIFQELRPTLRKLMHRLDREEKELSQLMHAMVAEEWEVALQIDQVEAARGALSKTRTLMLYRMHKELEPAQIEALHELWERRDNKESSSRGSRQR